jgi:hypothetical protein
MKERRGENNNSNDFLIGSEKMDQTTIENLSSN